MVRVFIEVNMNQRQHRIIPENILLIRKHCNMLDLIGGKVLLQHYCL